MWIIIITLTVCCWLYRKRYSSWLKVTSEVPDWRRPLPIIGNLLEVIFGDGRNKYKLLMQVTEDAEKRNSSIKVWFGPHLVYFISKPEDIKIVANAYIGKPFFYDFARPWVAEGLVTASVPVWKSHIKKLAPTFSPTVVDGFLGVFNTQLSIAVDKMRCELGQGSFPPFRKYLSPATLEMACQTAFGITDMSENIVTSEYMEAFNNVMELTMLRGFNPLVYPDFIYYLTPNYRKYKHSLAILHNVSSTVIKKKREALRTKVKGHENGTSYKNFKAFLDLLLELPEDEAFTEAELRAEVDTMIVGTQETTATTMLLMLLHVGSFPHVQENIYNELKDIFGDSDRPANKDDLRHMMYAEAVIKETLRLYPPIPAVMRKADHQLQLEKYKIASGTTCVICLWAAGRCKRTWGADADQFRPERWLNPDFTPPPAAYLPFSYGKRACIGRLYAIMVLKTALVHFLRTYKLKADVSKLQFKVDLVLQAIAGDKLEIELR